MLSKRYLCHIPPVYTLGNSYSLFSCAISIFMPPGSTYDHAHCTIMLRNQTKSMSSALTEGNVYHIEKYMKINGDRSRIFNNGQNVAIHTIIDIHSNELLQLKTKFLPWSFLSTSCIGMNKILTKQKIYWPLDCELVKSQSTTSAWRPMKTFKKDLQSRPQLWDNMHQDEIIQDSHKNQRVVLFEDGSKYLIINIYYLTVIKRSNVDTFSLLNCNWPLG